MSTAMVRQAQLSELPAILDLAVAFYAEGGFATPVQELHENLSVLMRCNDARVAIASRHGEILGFAVTTLGFGLEQGRVAELEDIYVRPSHRRTGVAAALIDDGATWALSHGCRELELVVAPHGDNAAELMDFYARRGFSNDGRRLLSRKVGPAAPTAR